MHSRLDADAHGIDVTHWDREAFALQCEVIRTSLRMITVAFVFFTESFASCSTCLSTHSRNPKSIPRSPLDMTTPFLSRSASSNAFSSPTKPLACSWRRPFTCLVQCESGTLASQTSQCLV